MKSSFIKRKSAIKKLLEFKSNNFKKKYFLLSLFTETNINNKNILKSKFNIYKEQLFKTNGKLPEAIDILSFYNENRNINSISANEAMEYANLNYNESLENQIIQEELQNIMPANNKVNKKLKESLATSISLKKPLLFQNHTKSLYEAAYDESNVVDLTSIFDDIKGPTREDLRQIEADEDYTDEDEASDPDSIPKQSGKTIDKIAQIFANIGKDPKKVSKKELAAMLGYTGLGKYVPASKTYKLSGWEKIEKDIARRMNTYENTGISILAKRKWWIIKSIETCLILEKQASKAFGTPDDVKSKFKTNDAEQISAIQSITRSTRTTGTSLSDAEGRRIMDDLHAILTRGNYDLENPAITERDLTRLLIEASRYRGDSAQEFERNLEIMYPLSDQRADFDRVPMQSDSDRQQTQSEVEDYFQQKEQEVADIYDEEIDPATGEPLYASDAEIENLKAQNKVIAKDDLIDEIIKTPVMNMTVIEFEEYMKKVDKDLKRLKQLRDKAENKINPDIFKEFETDSLGKIIPDIELIPDIIPAEGLTDSEKDEMTDIIIRLGQKQKITIINLDRRGEIYDELCDKAVSVDEFIAYRKNYGLDSSDTPMTWEDIARASYGKFRGGNASRQFGIKAWFRGLFYSLAPESKANIYSFLAEKWYDRLKILDLIDDKAFVRMPSKSGNPADDKAISTASLDKLANAGKYSRSSKLDAVSDTLELVSKYTQPRYVKRYLDHDREDSLDVSVQEKLNMISSISSSEEEYSAFLKRLEAEDSDTAAFALMDAMFNGNSGFRMFATGILKEYYNDIIWPSIEEDLAYAVKEYFETYYRGSNIGKSLARGQKSDDVKPEEGKELFNKIIYLVMQRTGIPSTGDRLPNVGDSRKSQVSYFKGRADPRGDFSKAVMNFNSKGYSNKLYGRTGSNYNPLNQAPFGSADVDMLLADMFSSQGIIGKVYANLSKLDSVTEADIITWIGDYPEAKLDQAIILGMSMSDFYRNNDVDPTILEVIEGLGKDTKKALEDYKKQFKGLLLGKDFADYLDQEFGFETFDSASKGSSNPGGKNFQ